MMLKRTLGLDRAIAYTVLAKGFQIIGSAGTVLLILHFLTSVEQGYYYTLLSLVALQLIFELGFSFVILQMAAHESVSVVLHEGGRIQGDATRLASLLRKTIAWYLAAGAIFMASLLPLGCVFFIRHEQHSVHVSWQGPWIGVVLATAVLFVLNPIVSFLEGCGQVRQVAGMRFVQGITATVVPWTAMLTHHGLYAPASVNAGFALVAAGFLYRKRRMLLPLLTLRSKTNGISWRKEVWPFQWRIALSYLCSYLTVQALTPIAFADCGAVEAGRLGMSINITGYLWNMVIAWMSTKAAPFGMLIARGESHELDRLFFATFKQSAVVLLAIVVACWAAIFALQSISRTLAMRMVSPTLFAFLLLVSIGNFVVQSEAIYLRAHKSEPFLGQSLFVAGLTFLGALVIVPHWGIPGATVLYLVTAGVAGPITATIIFRVRRNARRRDIAVSAALQEGL